MDELAKQFAALTTKYEPKVAAAALEAARISAYSSMTTALGICLVASGLVYLGYYLWWLNIEDKFDQPIIHAFGFFLGIIGAITFVVGFWTFLNPWTYTAIYHPELWLAKRAFGL